MNPVTAREGEFAACNHHHQSWLVYVNAVVLRVRFAHEVAYLDEMARSLFDLAVPQLEFNQGKATVREMQDAVGLKAISVTVIRKIPANRRCIGPQVPYAERLENKPKRLKGMPH